MNTFHLGYLSTFVHILWFYYTNTIDHAILSKEMHHLRFSESAISWFESYLTNRLFLVGVDNEFFPWQTILSCCARLSFRSASLPAVCEEHATNCELLL